MHRRHLLAASGALLAASIAGCLGDETRSDDDREPTDHLPASTPDISDDQLVRLARDNARFALDLYRHLVGDDSGNLFFSPYSISVALAMTFAGAGGETREQMQETLRYTLGEDVHPAFASLEHTLEERAQTEDSIGDDEEPIDAFQLSVANALWGHEDYPFAADFLDLTDEYYGAGLHHADFAEDPDGERERINAWVADRTEDRIDELLPAGSIDPSTILVLTNAIYFMASWAEEFDPEDTEDAVFSVIDGSESSVPMMHQHLRTNYADLDEAEAIELPYVGDDVSMVLILPEEGSLESFETDLDGDRLYHVFEELGDASGDLALPRFEFETDIQLSDALSALGMPDAFTSRADFGGMVDGDGGLWIDEAYHDAFVKVDEEGTEAAAATAVVMTESAPQRSFDLRFDRPFLFCIRDRPTNAVLFLGRVSDAGAAQA